MNVTSTISICMDIINQFLPIFTVPGEKIFLRLVNGWILCTVRRTITTILPFADPTHKRTAALSPHLHLVVRLWYLLQKANKRYFIVQAWNPPKSMPSFADAIACLRRELWAERIKCMLGVAAVHDKKFEFLLEALAPAA